MTAANATPAVAAAASYFVNRYWLCGCATAYTYPNGWSVPPTNVGVSVGGDDTVSLLDGYFISPNGVLHYPDGRMIEETLTSQRFIPARTAFPRNIFRSSDQLAAETPTACATRTCHGAASSSSNTDRASARSAAASSARSCAASHSPSSRAVTPR